jgi:hypothetical protein
MGVKSGQQRISDKEQGIWPGASPYSTRICIILAAFCDKLGARSQERRERERIIL